MANIAVKDSMALQPSINADLTISNYSELVDSVHIIQRHYRGMKCTDKAARKIRRRLNRLKRQLNDLRKTKSRPRRKTLKDFKHNIDYLINGIGKAEAPFQLQLKKARQNKLEIKQYNLQSQMNAICKARHIGSIHVPMEDVKHRASKADRLKVMVEVADQKQKYEELAHATIAGDQAISPDGKIVGHAKQLTFVGSPTKLDELEDLAKQHGIVLKG